jgi:hypothetical protein
MSDLKQRVTATQVVLLEAARETFSESELDDLRCVVRLVVEFHDFIANANLETIDKAELRYEAESVFSGVDSFTNVAAAYRVLMGQKDSSIERATISGESLVHEFMSMFSRFGIEEQFETKCRLLLDLFRLEIIFAGLFYD